MFTRPLHGCQKNVTPLVLLLASLGFIIVIHTAPSCSPETAPVPTLHVEYAEQRIEDGILCMFSSSYEYSNLEYEHVAV